MNSKYGLPHPRLHSTSSAPVVQYKTLIFIEFFFVTLISEIENYIIFGIFEK